MNPLLDDMIEDNIRMAELHERVQWLESAQLAEQAEVEWHLNNQYELVKRSKAEERARAADLLFSMNQRVFAQMSKPGINHDLYASIAALMMASETARNLLAEGVTL
jgi:hypothetical protein